MDGANWLAHYADHRVDALWRFHALHHSQEELSVLTSFRAVMQGVEAPERVDPVIGVMGQPVGPVHGHDRERDEQPARPVRGRAQLDPGRVAGDQRRRPDAEQRHQRDHHDGVQGQETRVLNVAAGQQRAPLGRPDPLADPGRDHEHHEQRGGELRPARGQHSFQAALLEQVGDGDPDDKGRYPGQGERGET